MLDRWVANSAGVEEKPLIWFRGAHAITRPIRLVYAECLALLRARETGPDEHPANDPFCRTVEEGKRSRLMERNGLFASENLRDLRHVRELPATSFLPMNLKVVYGTRSVNDLTQLARGLDAIRKCSRIFSTRETRGREMGAMAMTRHPCRQKDRHLRSAPSA